MFKKGFFIALTLLLVLIVLNGCSSSSSNGSYAGILMVNEKEYYWQGDIKDNEFTLGEKIGEVQKKVEKEVKPNENFSSNFLEVDEEIYSSNEDRKVIIVKRENGSLEKMTEEDYFKSE
jgi:thiamine biosynthesis lipoprotein ApbE